MSTKVTVSIRDMDRELWKHMACTAKMKDMTILKFIETLLKKELGYEEKDTGNKGESK